MTKTNVQSIPSNSKHHDTPNNKTHWVRNGDIVLSFDNKKVERFSDIMLHLLLDEPKTMQVLRDERVVSLEIPPTLVKKILAYSSNGFDQKALLAPRYKYNGEIVAFAQDAPARNAGIDRKSVV